MVGSTGRYGSLHCVRYIDADVYKALKTICDDKYRKLAPTGPQNRGADSVLVNIEKLLVPKTFNELEILETQISKKLRSEEPIDVEYWEQLLRNVDVYKAKAELDAIYKTIIGGRLARFKQEQEEEARIARNKLMSVLNTQGFTGKDGTSNSAPNYTVPAVKYSRELDPEPLLKLRVEDKGLDISSEEAFLDKVVRWYYSSHLSCGCSNFRCTEERARHDLSAGSCSTTTYLPRTKYYSQ